MWTYILGPFLALLPKPWRDSLSFNRYAQPARAAVLSGLAESAAALVALGYWYIHAMNTWVARGIDSAISGELGPVTDQAIASVALSVWFTHPLTLFLGYFAMEGAVRLCGAAFSESMLGTLPLFLFDKIFINPFRSNRNHSTADSLRANASSISSAIRERMMVARLSSVQDELFFRSSGTEELLEVSASSRKDDWNPPRVVRYGDGYYRLEAFSLESGPRPFRYSLRRLPAGVPGRSVLIYSPPDVLIRQ
jgi:hypothetical protein